MNSRNKQKLDDKGIQNKIDEFRKKNEEKHKEEQQHYQLLKDFIKELLMFAAESRNPVFHAPDLKHKTSSLLDEQLIQIENVRFETKKNTQSNLISWVYDFNKLDTEVSQLSLELEQLCQELWEVQELEKEKDYHSSNEPSIKKINEMKQSIGSKSKSILSQVTSLDRELEKAFATSNKSSPLYSGDPTRTTDFHDGSLLLVAGVGTLALAVLAGIGLAAGLPVLGIVLAMLSITGICFAVFGLLSIGNGLAKRPTSFYTNKNNLFTFYKQKTKNVHDAIAGFNLPANAQVSSP